MQRTLPTTNYWLRLGVAALLVAQPIAPAEIVVDGSCTLADAITASNIDSAVGSCPAGSGTDEIQLSQDVLLFSELPQLTDSAVLEGNGFGIHRDDSASDFSILRSLANGAITLKNVTLSNGRGTNGGGIVHLGGALILVNTTVTGNEATGQGGGIYSGDYLSSVSFVSSTISGNIAGGRGGGIYAGFYGGFTIDNSTVSGNVAGVDGGGGYVGGYGRVTLLNSTVISNSAPNAGGLGSYGDFTPQGHYARLDFENSILAYNPGGNCGFDFETDLGGNFDDDGSCNGASPITAGVDIDTTLADNGGPTSTHALLAGSVAIDAGGDCGLATDQRGFPRDDGACDSGSFEFGGAQAFSLAITGSCPGEVTITVTTPSPDQNLVLFAGPGEGTTIVPFGPCAGTELGLTLGRSWRRVRTGENGEASISSTVGSNWCGRSVQALDRSCSTSNVAQFP